MSITRSEKFIFGQLLASELQVGDKVMYPLDSDRGFKWVEDVDPATAWVMVRAIAPDVTFLPWQGRIADQPADQWHNRWHSKYAIVISNDPVARKVWALYRHDSDYALIVREYA